VDPAIELARPGLDPAVGPLGDDPQQPVLPPEEQEDLRGFTVFNLSQTNAPVAGEGHGENYSGGRLSLWSRCCLWCRRPACRCRSTRYGCITRGGYDEWVTVLCQARMKRRLLNFLTVLSLLLCVAVLALWASRSEIQNVLRNGGGGVAGGSDVATYVFLCAMVGLGLDGPTPTCGSRGRSRVRSGSWPW